MRQTSRVNLPPVPAGLDPKVAAYLVALDRALRNALQDVYIDHTQGTATLTAFTAAPVATDLAESQLGLRTDAGNQAIYVNVAGTIRSVAVT